VSAACSPVHSSHSQASAERTHAQSPFAVPRPPRRLQTSNLLRFPSAADGQLGMFRFGACLCSLYALLAFASAEKGTCWRHRLSGRRGDGADDSDVRNERRRSGGACFGTQVEWLHAASGPAELDWLVLSSWIDSDRLTYF
jgi:hypothetical protein